MAITRIGPNQSINLASNITGTLPTGNGGTGATSFSPGKVLQVVKTNSGTATNTNSTSYVATSLTANITPSSTSSKIYVIVTTDMDNNGNGVQAYATIYRDSTDLAGGSSNDNLANNYGQSSRVITPVAMSILDSPNTTSQVTYKVYCKSSNSGTSIQFNNQEVLGTITLMEIAG
jgi:hypothetical protein